MQNLAVCFYSPHTHPLKVSWGFFVFFFPLSCQIFVGCEKRKPSGPSVVSLDSLLVQPVFHLRYAKAGSENPPDKWIKIRQSCKIFFITLSACFIRRQRVLAGKAKHMQHRMYSIWINADTERDYNFDDAQVWRILIVLECLFVFRLCVSQKTALVWKQGAPNLDM